MTNVPLKFAFRYLFAKKSYKVINLISAVGVAGMAIGTAALIIILSVFNGFDKVVTESLSDASPDIVIKPAAGKVFSPDSLYFLLEDDDIVRLSSTLEDQVFVSYEGRQSLARVKGMDDVAIEESALQEHIVDGVWAFRRGDSPAAVIGVSLARSLGISPRFFTPLEIYYPSRKEAVSLTNPSASLRKVKLLPGGTFSVNSEMDAKAVLVPIASLRELLEYETEVSSLEIWAAPGKADATVKRLSTQLGGGFKVQDRYAQNESVLKMMRYEKLAIYLILIFVVLIVAFNIFSSLKMLVIEKQGDIGTLRSLGAPEEMLQRIFLLEGWLMSLLGMAIGLVLGIVFVILQARYGIVPMRGNFIVTSYPVVLKVRDILWTVAGVGLIGWFMALIPSRKLS